MKKIVSLVLCVVMVLSVACLSVFAAPEGTAIKTAEEFAAMKADGTYYLDADIKLTSTYVEAFTGTLDGNGHTVTITAPMFAEFNGTVSNLTIDGAELRGNEDLAPLAIFTKAFKAYNVTNKVDVTVTGADETVTTGLNAGGLVAKAEYAGTSLCFLRNCKNYGRITVETAIVKPDKATTTGDHYETHAGGFVGLADGFNAKFCENYGDITASGDNGQAGGFVGRGAGSAAYTHFDVHDSVSKANITGGLDAGGIAGYIGVGKNEIYEPYTVKYCVVTGEIAAGYRAGGFLGYAYASGKNLSYYIEVTDNVFVGNVSAGRTALTPEGKDRYSFASLFVGYSNSMWNTVARCVAWGEIKALTGEGFNTPFKVLMGCSSADTPSMPFESNFICDNNTTEWYSYATADSNADKRIELATAISEGKVERCTADEIKNGTIMSKLNAAAGDEIFAQKAGTDEYPVISESALAKHAEQDISDPDETTTEEETTPKETSKKDDTTTTPKSDEGTTTPKPSQETTTPKPSESTTAGDSGKSGCGSVVALSMLALVIPAAVVVLKKKEN